jgi:hypothetical protein
MYEQSLLNYSQSKPKSVEMQMAAGKVLRWKMPLEQGAKVMN